MLTSFAEGFFRLSPFLRVYDLIRLECSTEEPLPTECRITSTPYYRKDTVVFRWL
jgi:hypothetical protein